jgi:hypothetical protein
LPCGGRTIRIDGEQADEERLALWRFRDRGGRDPETVANRIEGAAEQAAETA